MTPLSQIDTRWFDVAVVATLLAFGNALFGRFSEHQSRGLRALRIVVGLALFVGVAATAGRPWMYALIAAIFGAIAVVHGWWLPRHGVNGWTAEPRERYYQLLGIGGADRADPSAVSPPSAPSA